MRRFMRTVSYLAGAFLIGWVPACRTTTETVVAIPDRDMGLRRTALSDDRVPEAVAYLGDSPGNNEKLPSSYEGAPPVIPHSLEGIVPITREENYCVACHVSGGKGPEDPPQVSRSHLIDWRSAPGTLREEVAGARWRCTACHVPRSTASPLVPNTFGSSVRD